MLPVIGAAAPWADPTVVQLNRLPAHVPLTGGRRRTLDGRWRLEMFSSPAAVPATALHGERRRSVEVDVPGNWTLQDLGDVDDGPQYTNVQMPFEGPPPRLPERNPTGVYRRSFRGPAAWRGGRVVLGVDGAESVHAVYLNGTFVGYGTDSRLPSEYDVTEHVRTGDNELAIVVIRFSAHSYVEDQDQWWMAGLHRSVWIGARPVTSIADVPVSTWYHPDTGAGSVAVATVVTFSGVPEPGWRVRSALADPAGRPVGTARIGDVPHRHALPYLFAGFVVEASWELPQATPWSAEDPQRYALTVELLDPRGQVCQSETCRVGVRSVEVRDRRLLVNGRPVWIFGVNRHDHHPDRGKAVTVGDVRADLVAMRRLNVNAIRTAHYPNRDELYDLCDELGFYVIDEANIEAHAYNRSLCDDGRYASAWLERGMRMVQRDRNHPSVIAWSLGNESGYGSNHDALAGWIRRADPSRPLHYEDAVRIEGWEHGGRAVTDLVCPMYPAIDEIRSHGARGVGDRPLIMCEYSHAMGNSNGSLADYWDAITATEGLQGGFVWEWKDHALRQRLPGGRARLAYGGQFGDSPHDANFVADGLMSADLDAHPAAFELAWVHRPVVTEAADGGVRIENRRSFSDLSDLAATVVAMRAGDVVRCRRWSAPMVSPQTTVTVVLPPLPEDVDLVRIEWRTRRDAWFAPAGHLVAWDEMQVAPPVGPQLRTDGRAPGPLISPRLSLWRAPVDNDGFKLMPELSRRLGVGGQALWAWREQGLDVCDPEELVEHRVTVEEERSATVYRHVVVVPDHLGDLPRVGVTFALPSTFDLIRWFGRGPHENYPDRNRSAMLGIWEGPPDELPYLVPQEFGLRTDCRWLELVEGAASGRTVRVESLGRPLHVSATNHTADDLFVAANASDLTRRDELVVHLDVAHRGVGTASCGPDVLDRYRIAPGRYELAYRVALIGG